MKILVTGFEPFDGENTNPALEAIQRLPQRLGAAELHTIAVPTVFGLAAERVIAGLDALRPAACLCIGQAGGRADIAIERVALNLADARIPDNAGQQPVDQAIEPLGPVAYLATLDAKAIVAVIRGQGIPASVSLSAGAFVCNHLLYRVLHHIQTQRLPIRAGFIHIPFLPVQVLDRPTVPSMALETVERALLAALTCISEMGA